MEKIIVSFATIPTRIHAIEPVIQSLLNQSVPPNEIHIQIPEFCRKTNSVYEIPDFLNAYDSVVKIKHREVDFGPICKLYYPILDFKERDDVLLFIVDDDCSYRKDSIERVMERYRSKPACYCFSGGLLPKKPEVFKELSTSHAPLKNTFTFLTDNEKDISVDTVQGFGMYLLKPTWFDIQDLNAVIGADSVYHADDIIISGLMEKAGVPRIQIGPYSIPEVLEQAEVNPIHGEGRLMKMSKAALKVVQKELGVWSEVDNVPLAEFDNTFKSKVKRLIPRRLKDSLKSMLSN